MVIAYHIIFSAYGFWLPNDPRGSWSTEVWARNLKPFGDPVAPGTTRSVAGRAHDREKRLMAKTELAMPAVKFTGPQALAIANGFADIRAKLSIAVHACAIMPDHVHLVITRHEMLIEDVTGVFKRAATRRLNAEGIHPLRDFGSGARAPTPWAAGGWHVYLNTPEEVRLCVEYVERNPIKAGLKAQRWKFVTPPAW